MHCVKDIKTWTSPSTTAPLNCRIVRRSNAIIGYGEKFTYREMVMNSNWMTAKLSQSKLSFKSSGNTVRHDENINPKTAFAKCYFKMKIIATPAESTDVSMKHLPFVKFQAKFLFIKIFSIPFKHGTAKQ